ncbi:hypothetical protein F7725_026700 [Dissostichus mawsoni]|uniref:Uncharacterized protein n=1 Tax=Dissostichus mawsoni TaxID=36200 RepID=A0A7J5X7U6_DISMA|nr:hypothetical protein F7725_026700 [Dissostichus mawsoni]
MLRGMLFLGLLSVLCHGQASQEVSAEDFGADRPEPATDRDLIEALEALLGRMHDRSPSTEKRGTIALCGMGDRCAMKFGPRIGKLVTVAEEPTATPTCSTSLFGQLLA